MVASISFLDDIRLLSEMYSVQRSKEIAAAAGVAQQPAGTHAQQEVAAQAQFSPQPPLNPAQWVVSRMWKTNVKHDIVCTKIVLY